MLNLRHVLRRTAAPGRLFQLHLSSPRMGAAHSSSTRALPGQGWLRRAEASKAVGARLLVEFAPKLAATVLRHPPRAQRHGA
jgi:hypothetical protein